MKTRNFRSSTRSSALNSLRLQNELRNNLRRNQTLCCSRTAVSQGSHHVTLAKPGRALILLILDTLRHGEAIWNAFQAIDVLGIAPLQLLQASLEVSRTASAEGRYKVTSLDILNMDRQLISLLSTYPVACAVIFRLLNACCSGAFFQPDEYWQSLEVAHRLAHGYGFATWEWRTRKPAIPWDWQDVARTGGQGGIRSPLYPAIFVPLYCILDYLGIRNGPLLVRLGCVTYI